VLRNSCVILTNQREMSNCFNIFILYMRKAANSEFHGCCSVMSTTKMLSLSQEPWHYIRVFYYLLTTYVHYVTDDATGELRHLEVKFQTLIFWPTSSVGLIGGFQSFGETNCCHLHFKCTKYGNTGGSVTHHSNLHPELRFPCVWRQVVPERDTNPVPRRWGP
jgi:hypothetical protein